MSARPTPAELEAQLTPRLRAYRDEPRSQFYPPAGWYPLIGQLDRDLAALAGREDYCVYQQVKDKFGGLRFYVSLPTDIPEDVRKQMWALIREAERRSFEVCEDCGRPGEERERRGWLATLCDECDADRQTKRRAL